MNNLELYIKNQNSNIHEVFTQHILLYRLETQGVERWKSCPGSFAFVSGKTDADISV